MPPKKRTELLELVREEPGLPVATLAERIGCGVSYAYRMVDWLEEHGDIVRTKGNSASNAGGVFPATDGAIWVEKAGTTAPAAHHTHDQGKQVDRLVELAVGSGGAGSDSIRLGERWQVIGTRLGDEGETIVTLRSPRGAEIDVTA